MPSSKFDPKHPIAIAIFTTGGTKATAKKLGVSPQYIQKIRSQGYVPFDLLEAFCAATGARARDVAHPRVVQTIDKMFATHSSK